MGIKMSSLEKVQHYGLFNQGATCYLNSVLQVLCRTAHFRAALERHPCENAGTGCVDCHLTTLFADLNTITANTNSITHMLGINRVNEQRDAAECFEKILILTSPSASEVFHGMLTHKTKCSACGTETNTDGEFWHLPLALLDSQSVVGGIENYFRTSYFSGENQMYCDQCEAKSDATIKCEMKRHPEVLVLLLKRFEYGYMTYVKNCCAVNVPCTLQIPENQTYELHAVVDHFGDLRSGHYTATIKDNDRWCNFNDDRVTVCEPFQEENSESRSAYLLFYRKINVHAADTPNSCEASTPSSFLPVISNMNQCQDAAKGPPEEGKETVTTVSIIGNEETGIKDSVGSRGVGLPPDPSDNVDDQNIGGYTIIQAPNKHQECNEDRTDFSYYPKDAEKQRDEGKIITDDGGVVGGNAEAQDQAEKRETLSREAQFEHSFEDQDNDHGRQRTPDISHDFKPEVSDRYEVHGHPNKQDEMSNIETHKDGRSGDDEKQEMKRKCFTNSPDRDAEQDYSRTGQDISKDLQGTQEGGQDYDLKPSKRMETEVKVEKEAETETYERRVASETSKLLTICDLYLTSVDHQRRDDRQRRPHKDVSVDKQRGEERMEDKERESEADERRVASCLERNRGRRRWMSRESRDKRGDDKHAQSLSVSQKHHRQKKKINRKKLQPAFLLNVRKTQSDPQILIKGAVHQEMTIQSLSTHTD